MPKETLGSLGGEDAEVTAPDETTDTTPQEKKDEAEYSALFGSDAPDDEEPEVEETTEELFEGTKEPPKDVPYARFAKVIGERNELREKLSLAEGQTSIDDAIKGVIDQHYSAFKDPAAQMTFDASFMEALEEIAGKSPNHKRFAAEVQHYIKTKELPNMTEPTDKKTTTRTEPEPAADARVEALLEKETRRDIHAVLDDLGVKASFRNVLTDYYIGSMDDLTRGVNPNEVVKFARNFIKHNGFEKTDVLAEIDPKKTPDKPPTGSDKGVATAQADTKDELPEKDRPKPVKDLDEWQANHQSRVKALLAEM